MAKSRYSQISEDREIMKICLRVNTKENSHDSKEMTPHNNLNPEEEIKSAKSGLQVKRNSQKYFSFLLLFL